MSSPERQRLDYWHRTLWLTLALLALWALVTFAPAWWARDLNRITVFGWPLAFYMGAQGSLIVYVLIVWIYARAMDRLDRRYGVDEADLPVAAAAPRQAEDADG
jgi:putative solute:sodium symporter small subunit